MSKKSSIKECAQALQQVREEQNGLDFSEVIAEVFEDIRANPGIYSDSELKYSPNYAPPSERTRHHIEIQNYSGTVQIFGDMCPIPQNFVSRLLVSPKRVLKARMTSPVPVNLTPEQTKTFYKLAIHISKWKKDKDIKDKVDQFRNEKQNRDGSNIKLNMSSLYSNNSSFNSNNIVFNTQSIGIGQKRITPTGKTEIYDGNSWLEVSVP